MDIGNISSFGSLLRHSFAPEASVCYAASAVIVERAVKLVRRNLSRINRAEKISLGLEIVSVFDKSGLGIYLLGKIRNVAVYRHVIVAVVLRQIGGI